MTQKSSAILIVMVLAVAMPAAGQSSQKSPGGSDVLHQPVDRSGSTANPSGSLGGWTRTILALALVIALIFAVRFVARKCRLGGSRIVGGSREAVKVLAAANISSRERLFVVKFAGRVLLVGSSPTGLRTLSEVSDADEVAELLGNIGDAAAGAVRKESSGKDAAGKPSADRREGEA